MICAECNENEVIMLYKNDNVKFICKNGHIWYEDYIDRGGTHKRPGSYGIELEDVLFPSERIIYDQIIREIEKNSEFYNKADDTEKAMAIIKDCNINEKDIYSLFKKIVSFKENKLDY